MGTDLTARSGSCERTSVTSVVLQESDESSHWDALYSLEWRICKTSRNTPNISTNIFLVHALFCCPVPVARYLGGGVEHTNTLLQERLSKALLLRTETQKVSFTESVSYRFSTRISIIYLQILPVHLWQWSDIHLAFPLAAWSQVIDIPSRPSHRSALQTRLNIDQQKKSHHFNSTSDNSSPICWSDLALFHKTCRILCGRELLSLLFLMPM